MCEHSLEQLVGELDSLIGLYTVKQAIREIIDFQLANQKRRAAGATYKENQTLHMLFTGNPGTGKTTVARLVGRIFKALGILKKGTFTEVKRNDLVGLYVGNTADKTVKVVESALEGVLFIDEAYALSRSDLKADYGYEAIDTLVPMMEDYRDRLIIIFAGYTREMEQFINANSGIKSRVAYTIDFPDYNGEEMHQIFLDMCRKDQYVYSAEISKTIQKFFIELYENRGLNFGNGRDVRNFYEAMVRQQSKRIMRDNITQRQALMTFTLEDIPIWGKDSSKKVKGLGSESSKIKQNNIQPHILAASVAATRSFYEQYHDGSGPIPPLIIISPPVLHAEGPDDAPNLSGIEPALSDNVRDFLNIHYSINDLTHPAKFLGGAIRTKLVHSEAAIETLHWAYQSIPTRVIESQADHESIRIYLAQWDIKEPIFHYKKVLSYSWKDADSSISQIIISLSACHNILIAFAVDVYHFLNYGVYPKLPALLPELISLISSQSLKQKLIETLLKQYQSMYQAIASQSSVILPEFILEAAYSLSSNIDKIKVKAQIEDSMKFWLQIKLQKKFSFTFNQLIKKILSTAEVNDQSYFRKLCRCFIFIEEYDVAAQIRNMLNTWSESKINGKIKRDGQGDTLYVY